jgi:hypothetical protein
VAEQLEPGGVHAAGVVDQAGDSERRERLPGAGLAHDPDGLAASYGERDLAHRPDRAGWSREGDLEVAHDEHQVRAGVVGLLRRGFARQRGR